MLPTTSHDPELAIIALACAGDRRAFSRLVETYQTPLYNLCYRMLGNPHDAEEAAQEAFLRAYTWLDSYDPARPFKTWLFAIADHYCIDRLRRRRLTWLSLDDEPALDTAAWRSSAPTPEETAMRRERDADIQALLASLPPKDRSALVMRYWYDLSYEEIAAATATTVSAVKGRLHRARCALESLVNPSENVPPGMTRSPRRPALARSCPAI
jgi:RNA polymerase sigma-70 factor (ECF subfamily)